MHLFLVAYLHIEVEHQTHRSLGLPMVPAAKCEARQDLNMRCAHLCESHSKTRTRKTWRVMCVIFFVMQDGKASGKQSKRVRSSSLSSSLRHGKRTKDGSAPNGRAPLADSALMRLLRAMMSISLLRCHMQKDHLEMVQLVEAMPAVVFLYSIVLDSSTMQFVPPKRHHRLHSGSPLP